MLIHKYVSVPEALVPVFHQDGRYPESEWFCCSDPAGRKAGSGGGTAWILYRAFEESGFEGRFEDWLAAEQRMVIHSGGESRRLPAYAATGKSMIPVPVFRWSRGQYIDQVLLDFQASFYGNIMRAGGEHYSLLIGAGDVLFLSGDRFRDLPAADILCLGIWVDDPTASRHGVFFSRKDDPGALSFVIQKPSIDELEHLASRYYYLMDSGIWLFSEKAVGLLMERCGWDRHKQAFTAGFPGFYDLYGTMGAAFGSEARATEGALNGLDVKIVPMQEGEFYHFGSSEDVIASCSRLQNRVIDQRRMGHHENRRHPSVFQQNARTAVPFGGENLNIWIENANVSEGWTLRHDHMITNIPVNTWNIDLPAGICLDLLPLDDGSFCLRVYGFHDRFRGSLNEGVSWLNRPLAQWMEERGIDRDVIDAGGDTDIFRLPLFPVVQDAGQAEAWIQWITGRTAPGAMPAAYASIDRLSLAESNARAAAGEILKQREIFRKGNLEALARNHERSIFYRLDLKKAAACFLESRLELPPALSGNEELLKGISDSMFRSLIAGTDKEKERYERQAFTLLRQGLMATMSENGTEPHRHILDDQILWGRSPVRLDLAGGWTDTPPNCIINGGKVVNLAVELNGQPPLQVFTRPIKEPAIILRSIDLGNKEVICDFEALNDFAMVGGAFSIPKAALVLTGFGNEAARLKYGSLAAQMEDFGCGIELTLLAAVPKGSGLGTSSMLAATTLGTLNRLCGLGFDRHEISHRTLILEQMLTTGGGWQDQYGGVFGGVKLLETRPGIIQKPTVKWLPETLFSDPEYRDLILLYYTGVTRTAKDILGEIVKGMFLNSGSHLSILSEMESHALDTYETILHGDYCGLAERVRQSWELNCRLDPGTEPPAIKAIAEKVDDLLLGYKLLGAGGGGYMVMFAREHEAALRVRELLTADPPNKKARFMDFQVSREGLRISGS